MTETPGVPVTGEVSPARLSNQLDFDVWNQNGEQIGEVNDMVVDLDNSMISYVIVGVGGFLEIGEKDVLVPWSSLSLETSSGDMTGGKQNAFIFQGDQELFNNAPDIDVSEILPDRGATADDWDADIRKYWETGVVPATAAPEATADPAVTATASPEATAVPETTTIPEGTTGSALQGVMLASDLLDSDITVGTSGDVEGGSTVDATAMPDSTATAIPDVTATAATDAVDTVQENVNAEIDDAIVAVDTGEIRYIIIDADFDNGERLIPVPLNFLLWHADDDAFSLNLDPAALRDAPSFPDGEYPDMTVDDWGSDFDAYWQNIEPAMPAETVP
jgi:sporulation protein YlmC with PRC-barrel domain